MEVSDQTFDPRQLPKTRSNSAMRAVKTKAKGKKRASSKPRLTSKTVKRFKQMRRKKQRLGRLLQSDFIGYAIDPQHFVPGEFYKFRPVEDMKCMDNVDGNGFIHYMDEDKTVPACVLLPASSVADEHPELLENKIPFLECLQKICKDTKRGLGRTGHSESDGIFITFGVIVLQGRRGLAKAAEILKIDDEKLKKRCVKGKTTRIFTMEEINSHCSTLGQKCNSSSNGVFT